MIDFSQMEGVTWYVCDVTFKHTHEERSYEK